jgi:peptide chain release factor 1
MFAKLEQIEEKFEQLERDLSAPDVFSDQDRYRSMTRAHAEISEIVVAFRRYKQLKRDLSENREMLSDSDPEIRLLAKSESNPFRKPCPRSRSV